MSKGKYKRKTQRAQERAQQKTKEIGLLEKIEITQIHEAECPTNRKKESTDGEQRVWKQIVSWVKNKSSFTDWAIMLFTGVLAATSIIQFYITRTQLVEGEKAFVYAEDANISGVGNNAKVQRPPGSVVQAQITLKNSGQTVAKKFSGSINFLITPGGPNGGIPSDFTYPEDVHTFSTLVAPGSETSLVKPISDSDRLNVESGQAFLFIYGDASYEDVFGTHHKTEFCFQYYAKDTNPDGTLNRYLFFQGPTHNCSDDDCQDNK